VFLEFLRFFSQDGVQEFLISEKRSPVAQTLASLLLTELRLLCKGIILIAEASLLTCFEWATRRFVLRAQG